jgi:hypothetical protein
MEHRQSAAAPHGAQTIGSSATSPSQQQHTRKEPQQPASLPQQKNAGKKKSSSKSWPDCHTEITIAAEKGKNL